MTFYRDLEPCEYFDRRAGPKYSRVWSSSLRAVGWLSADETFQVGSVPSKVRERLQSLLHDAWQPVHFLGDHECELCVHEPTDLVNASSRRQFDESATGFRNLFVPGGRCVYVAPELVLHYMDTHGYEPPSAFCKAVLDCPPMNSGAYFQALLNSASGDFLRAIHELGG